MGASQSTGFHLSYLLYVLSPLVLFPEVEAQIDGGSIQLIKQTAKMEGLSKRIVNSSKSSRDQSRITTFASIFPVSYTPIIQCHNTLKLLLLSFIFHVARSESEFLEEEIDCWLLLVLLLWLVVSKNKKMTLDNPLMKETV